MNLDVMISMICEKGPETVYRELMSNDEGIRRFISQNENKSTNEMIREYKLDILK